MVIFPNAKINLGLYITEKRPDGYHNLETVFYPIPLEDVLEIKETSDTTSKCVLNLYGIEIAGAVEDNLIVKAYSLLDNMFHLPSIEVYLYKHIPSGAGMGGGSSDAAFMLKLLNAYFQLKISDKQLEAYAGTLGADCAFFIKNTPTFAEGIGNIFSPINISLKGYRIKIIKPNIFVSTRDAFLRIRPRKPEYSLKDVIQLPICEWKNVIHNNFEESVFFQYPEIGKIKEKLYSQGAVYASMSGSGSSVFGLFPPDITLPKFDFEMETFCFDGTL